MIRRRKLFILFAFVLMIILLSNIFAATITSYKPRYGITTARVNFRSNPSLVYSTIIKQVNKGVHLKMVGEYSNFYIVQLPTNEVGLISKDYIRTVTSVSPGKVYTRYAPYDAVIAGSNVNIRRGPSTAFTRVTTLSQGTNLKVVGKIDNFFTVIYSGNRVGMVEGSLIRRGTTTSTTTPAPAPAPAPTPAPGTSNLSNADLIIKYINDERAKQGLSALTKDWKLADISLRKSNEMVEKNYFLHTSPTYGTPFDMMKNFGITYKTAGENLAGNSNMKSAVDAWMKSEGHRKNILSTSYNHIGVGVTKSDRYGFIIVAMFIGR